MVVSGEGLIRFRRIDSDIVIEYRVSGDKLEVVDIPPGYTHSIVNVGETDLVTIMWVNECFDPEHTDTYYMEV
jgi:UDP-2-acetamido-2,6-beta-L-arabino-hexul-4-ose reductase